jgi:NitT/TauT family transport system substrate-binding protein
MNTRRTWGVLALAAALATVAHTCVASAQTPVPEIRFARQFSMGYLQLAMMERFQLVEKHAKLNGIPEVKVVWSIFNSPSAMNDALLSGNVDIVSGGVPGLLTIWAKTQNTSNPVKGVATYTAQPILLNTRNPNVKTIADFTEKDKIALPAVKVAIQALILQMAAAKLWGDKEFAKLDPLTVSMAPPDSTIALLGGGSEINSHFSVPPYQTQELEKPGITTVLNSFDVFGPHTFTTAWTSTAFREKNPALYKALIAAMTEATEMLQKDVRPAAEHWQAAAKSKLSIDQVTAIASGPQVKWTMAPVNSMKFAEFMHSVGSIKVKPAIWKDMYFPEVHGLEGN